MCRPKGRRLEFLHLDVATIPDVGSTAKSGCVTSGAGTPACAFGLAGKMSKLEPAVGDRRLEFPHLDVATIPDVWSTAKSGCATSGAGTPAGAFGRAGKMSKLEPAVGDHRYNERQHRENARATKKSMSAQ